MSNVENLRLPLSQIVELSHSATRLKNDLVDYKNRVIKLKDCKQFKLLKEDSNIVAIGDDESEKQLTVDQKIDEVVKLINDLTLKVNEL